eukprot:8858760-Pyramimonas_sp.AAC.1
MRVDIVKELGQRTGLPEEKAKALAGKLLGSVETLCSTNEVTKKALAEAVPDLPEWKALSDTLIDEKFEAKGVEAGTPPDAAGKSPLQVAAATAADAMAKAAGDDVVRGIKSATPITSKEQVGGVMNMCILCVQTQSLAHGRATIPQ